MVILGLDVGYALPGIAVVKFKDPPVLATSEVLKIGVFESKRNSDSRRTDDDVRRITAASLWIKEQIKLYRPDLVVAELPLSGARSAQAIRAMALATGYVVGCLATLGVPVMYVTPYDTKKACAGHIHAEKDDMIAAADTAWKDKIEWPVSRGKRLSEIKAEAMADALCAILTWFLRRGT